MMRKETKKQSAMDELKRESVVVPEGSDTILVTGTQAEEGAAQNQEEGRVAELEAALQSQQDEVQKLRDELLRRAADFENFRRQKERESGLIASRALENIVRELLPLADDVRRVLQFAPPEEEIPAAIRPYIDGVELVRKSFDKWFAEKGVSVMEAIGSRLDVNFHEAISQIDHPDAEPDTIVDEYQSGYLLGDKVIRYAKVIVAK